MMAEVASPLSGAAAMTVGAPNLALRDLPLDDVERVTTVDQPAHRRPLDPNVIELEYDKIGAAAVHARTPPQDRGDERDISMPREIRIESGWPHGCSRGPTPSGTPPVTVRADHVALGHFLIDRGVGATRRNESGHL
jgi:hypothetical protein